MAKPRKAKKAARKTPKAIPGRAPRNPVMHKTVYTATGQHIVKLGYKAAKEIRKSGRGVPQGGSGDFHLQYDRAVLRAASQAGDRDNGIFQSLIGRGLDNILGPGITVQARTGNTSVNAKIERLWAEYSLAPEARQIDNWATMERLVMRQLWVDGDVGGIKLDSGLVQVVESEQIARQAGVNDTGIDLDKRGKPLRYWVAGYTKTGTMSSKSDSVKPEDFVFVANRLRSSQTRGVPVMTPNLPMIHRINDVLDSEAISWQLLSRIAIAIYQRDSAEKAFNSTQAIDGADDDDLASRVVDVGNALIFHGEPGEEIKGIERNIPGVSFGKSIEVYMRLLGLPLGMPLELVMLDFSKTNYSSARAAFEQAYRSFRGWQRLLVRKWHTPIYEWKVAEWVKDGKLSARDDILKAEWFPPPFPWIDPLKEAQAKAETVDRGFSTYSNVLTAQNMDRADVIAQRKQEVLDAMQAAEDIEKKTGQAVRWQVFAGFAPDEPVTNLIVPGGGETDNEDGGINDDET